MIEILNEKHQNPSLTIPFYDIYMEFILFSIASSGAFRYTFLGSRFDTIHQARFVSRYDPDTEITQCI